MDRFTPVFRGLRSILSLAVIYCWAACSQAGYVLMEDFSSLTIGAVQGQHGWVDSTGVGKVATDPLNSANKVLSLPGVNAQVYRAMGGLALAGNATGTVYFRMYRPGTTFYAYQGLSASAAPVAGDTSDFETQLGSDTTNPGILKTRDSGAYDSLGSFKSNVWYSVWIVCDGPHNLYSIYVQGGDFTTQKLLADSNGQTKFTYRNTSGDGLDSNTSPVSKALTTFVVKTRTSHVGPFYIDDIYVDTTSANLTTPSAGPDTTPPTLVSVSPAAGATISNLVQVVATFSEPVFGASALDLLVNEIAANSVSISGNTCTFTVTPPPAGTVQVRFDPAQNIADAAGNRFNATNVNWSYTLVDTNSPTVLQSTPAADATVSRLGQVEIVFTKPVTGVDAVDLLINGKAATNVSGSGFGPYLFSFAQPALGSVRFSWAANNGIADMASTPHSLLASPWTNTLVSASAQGTVIINEFLAANVSTNGLRDEDGELEGWIELFNPGASAVNLTGWSLTDDNSDLGKWTFPQTSLGAGSYLVVFASGKDRRPANGTGPLHTSFKLSAYGDYLALCPPEFPRVPASEFSPNYPAQRNDYSYGLAGSSQWSYFAVPSPGAPNGNSVTTNALGAVHFSVKRGLFNAPFSLTLSPPEPGASIRYTVDGSLPTESNGQVYSGPISIDTTTTLRAAAFKQGSLPSQVVTHSYVFPSSVLSQPSSPPGFPMTTQWDQYGYPSDYGVNPAVVNDPRYSATLTNDLMAIPTLSIVMDVEDIFGVANGIYTHLSEDNSYRGPDWERACSLELINPDGSQGFQCDAGIEMHGGGSRVRTLKHPMRIQFKGKFGPSKLQYQFFPDSPIQEFDTIDLRSEYNNHWNHGGDANQRSRGTLVRDAWFKDTELGIGNLSGHSRYVHLYINGLYWGVYNPCEVANGSFGAAYLGGDKSDYDAYNGTGLQLVDGDPTAHTTMLGISGLQSLSQYDLMRQYLDVVQYADYMILQIFGGNEDWGSAKNWYCLRKREPGAGFKYLCWDSERTLEGINDLPMGVSSISALNSVSPDGLQAKLVASPEYRLLFADRVQKHFFNGGVLTTNTIIPRWKARASQIDRAIVGESARWGAMMTTAGQPGTVPLSPLPYPTYVAGGPYTRDDNWIGEQNRLFTNYFPFRGGVVLNQFRAVGLYPTNVMAPDFSQFGGHVQSGFALSLNSTNTIYYTTNGTDPRVRGTGAISSSAVAYKAGTPIRLATSATVKARALQGTTNWSALVEAPFEVDRFGCPLRIAELMYNPIGGSDYEYLELLNSGADSIDLNGASFEGITFVFPSGSSIAGGGRLVLANNGNPAKWATRYPGITPIGWYGGSLNNAGERIALLDRDGVTLCSVTYSSTNGWPVTDSGASIELADVNSDANDPANWHATTLGTPGAQPTPNLPSTLVINEIMALNVAAVTNAGTTPDWVELFNAGTNAINTAQWSLSDDGNPRKFVLPATNLPPGGYLLIWCDAPTNSVAGLHSGFTLRAKGGDLWLYDAATNRADACGYGLQVADYSVGRIGANWCLTLPTPATANVAASVAASTNLVMNEWLANPAPGGDDWIELFNRDTNKPAALQGMFLSCNEAVSAIRSLSFVGPKAFVQLIADKNPGPEHLDFKLPSEGGTNSLYDSTGQVIDRVVYGPQSQDASEGRLPDGAPAIVVFPQTASPGASNYIPNYSGPIINEVMAINRSTITNLSGHTADWVELYNPGSAAFDLTGYRLGASSNPDSAWVFPAGVSLAAHGYMVIWFDNDRAASSVSEPELNTGRAISGDGDTTCLFNPTGLLVDAIEFGPQAPDYSVGRVNGNWALLAKPTPGASNSAAALLGSPAGLRLNEWLAMSSPGQYEFVELFNPAAQPVELSGLYLSDDPSIAGLTQFQIPPLSFIGPSGFVAFNTDGHPSEGANHVNFQLDGQGESLRLYSGTIGIIDTVDFGSQAAGSSQGRWPDGADNIATFDCPTPASTNGVSILHFTRQPNAQVTLNGASSRFEAHADGFGSLSYQWLRSGTAITGATNSSLVISNAQFADAGTYRVVANNSCGAITSAVATLTVAAPPSMVTAAFTAPGTFKFVLAGEPGLVCAIDKATNLVNAVWIPVTNISFTSGALPVFDPAATNDSAYYRIRFVGK